ncbi:hypothetical protein DFH07DRAFT_463426 [Mycena maculata]|uniref:F-box domain-containing protein n=1 Tax=Mycena maculata TaxID=230809 RepID=A0AAD7K9P8_9AGAR|nr:hypothetical protein DFH07DRAFT_463426 [Mycena maculata]
MSSSRCSECGAATIGTAEEPLNLDVTPGTLYHALLTTNEPPQGAEFPFIQSVILKTDAHLACLDEEILRLRDRLEQLEEERRVLSEYRAQNTGILSPLRRMPPEILSEIILWTVPTIPDARAGLDLENSPWALTHISSRWRAVSTSTPSL